MRIISGKYKGKNLIGFNIDGTRPTMDRVKESLFGIIQDYIKGSTILDLFAGSGSLGIESLSNGADSCYFFDNNIDNMINITYPDGSVRQYEAGVNGLDIAKSISPRLASDVLAVSVNKEIYDLLRPINSDASIRLHKWEDAEAKKTFWHSSSHLMAEALEALFPGI